jgi:nickel/cobalt exporter
MELFLTIPAAIGLGALHSLEPGHGKGVLSAYLITTHAKTKDAIMLGFTSAVTHTLTIVVLAFLTSSTVKWLAPESLIHWIEVISGILITLIGANILYRHLYPRMISMGKLSLQYTAGNEHDHHEHHHHHHSHETPTSLRRMMIIGILTGLIPCPSAMAIFLAALTADQIPLGVELVAAFSLGSAITMSTIGILVIRAGAAVKKLEKINFARRLNLISSLLILGLGIFVTMESLFQL